MASASPPSVTTLLQRNATFGSLLARNQLHLRLLQVIRDRLPKALAVHCFACVLDVRGCLTLYVDTASWASRLRYYQPHLLPALTPIAPVRRIRTRVFLPMTPVSKVKPLPGIPSPIVVEQMERSVASVADPDVRHALQRLVHTLRQSG